MQYVVSTVWVSAVDGCPKYADFKLISAVSPIDAEAKYTSVMQLSPYVTGAYCFGTVDECRNPNKMDCQQLSDYMRSLASGDAANDGGIRNNDGPSVAVNLKNPVSPIERSENAAMRSMDRAGNTVIYVLLMYIGGTDCVSGGFFPVAAGTDKEQLLISQSWYTEMAEHHTRLEEPEPGESSDSMCERWTFCDGLEIGPRKTAVICAVKFIPEVSA